LNGAIKGLCFRDLCPEESSEESFIEGVIDRGEVQLDDALKLLVGSLGFGFAVKKDLSDFNA
jgi:hypothetical protein